MKSLTLIRGIALAGALMLSNVTPALAASGENTPLQLSGGTTTHVSAGGSSSLLRVVVSLVLVVAVIYGISWILRHFKAGKSRPSGAGIAQLASLPLGGGRSLTLVRAGREVHLLGVAEHGVTNIRTYSEAEAIAGGIELPADGPAGEHREEKPLDRVLDVLRRMTVRS
jgi:flagellar protein FliO/FliZ